MEPTLFDQGLNCGVNSSCREPAAVARNLLSHLPVSLAQQTPILLVCGMLGLAPEFVSAANGSAASDMARAINRSSAAHVRSMAIAQCKSSKSPVALSSGVEIDPVSLAGQELILTSPDCDRRIGHPHSSSKRSPLPGNSSGCQDVR